MFQNIRDRRVTRHGRNIVTDEERDSSGFNTSEKPIFDTVVVTEFISNPVEYLSKPIENIEVLNPHPAVELSDRSGKKLKNKLDQANTKLSKFGASANEARSGTGALRQKILAKSGSQSLLIKTIDRILAAVKIGDRTAVNILQIQYEKLYNTNEEISNLKAELGEDSDIITKIVPRLSALTATNSIRRVANPELVNVMPPNSILGIKISDINKLDQNQHEVFFPFFPTHFSLPVKAGEQVWTFYDNIQGKKVGYWMHRKIGTLPVEDLNYTHLDRNSTLQTLRNVLNSNTTSQVKREILEKTLSGFVNPSNSGVPNSNTLAGDDAYEEIVSNSSSYQKDYLSEAVPRHYKKCSDLVLQGSNNTLVSLTSTENRVNAGSGDEGLASSGMIELVCGRGRSGALYDGTLKIDNARNRHQRNSASDVLTEKTVKRGVPVDNLIEQTLSSYTPNTTGGRQPEASLILNSVDQGTISMRSFGNIEINTNSLAEYSSFHDINTANTSINSSESYRLNTTTLEIDATDTINMNSSKISLNNANEPYVIHSALESILDKLIGDVATLNQTMIGILAATGLTGTPPQNSAALIAIGTAIASTPPPLIISNVQPEMNKLNSKTIFGSK